MLPLSEEFSMWFIVGGILLMLISSVFESMWEFGRQVKPEFKPAFLELGWKQVILVVWVVTLLIGAALLLWAYPIAGIVGVVVYWLAFPIVVGSRVRRRLLPPWDDLKGELEKEGYNERNYWRRGDWWKADSHKKSKSD